MTAEDRHQKLLLKGLWQELESAAHWGGSEGVESVALDALRRAICALGWHDLDAALEHLSDFREERRRVEEAENVRQRLRREEREEEDRLSALAATVACPTCHSVAGANCRTPSGYRKHQNGYRQDRLRAATSID